MHIGELSRRTGVSVRMLRYYESKGLLRPARRASGYRLYGDAEVQMVKRIRTLNAAGLTLDTIRRILPCARPGARALEFAPCVEFQASLRRHIAALDGRISELSESRRILDGYLASSA